MEASAGEQRARALEIARGMLEGSVDLVDGCSALARRRDERGGSEVVPALFAGLASELDDVPSTRVRREWHEWALAEKLQKIEQYRAQIIASARELVASLSDG